MNSKRLKIILIILFIIYLILLFDLMIFGRYGFQIMVWNQENFNNYLNNSVNLIPFHTIWGYTYGFINGHVSVHNFNVNILGNIVAFMPFAFFIPLLFPKINSLKKFIVTMIGIVITMELLQFITLSGSCDIDDLILNVIGASIMYIIIKSSYINDLIKKILFKENIKIQVKKLIIFILIIITILTIGYVILNSISLKPTGGTKITGIIDTAENCDDALELFYENDSYEYYFPCIKSHNVYLYLNNREKILLTDALKNKRITIQELEDSKLIEFIKQTKSK